MACVHEPEWDRTQPENGGLTARAAVMVLTCGKCGASGVIAIMAEEVAWNDPPLKTVVRLTNPPLVPGDYVMRVEDVTVDADDLVTIEATVLEEDSGHHNL
jgi:hypothetical protein